MTQINKMVLHGFKSFAKHTEMVFGDKFNCVLGPNGSGKSNVLDALCFVLGKSSAKSLRAEKSSNLIYNGGKSKNPAKQGEVSIFFDNKSKEFPTEDEEVKITRIVKQSGQSIYKINDKVRTRQQIVDLLNIAKIDPDSYNIILQGDIVNFVNMSTNDRRLLIEDISGISLYEEKKNKALSQLSKVDERLKEAEIVLTERQTYLKELKKDRDQALKFKDLTDKIKMYKATLVKLDIDKKEAEQKELKENIEKTKQQLEKLNSKIQELKDQNLNKKQDIENISKEIEEKGEVEQVNLNKEIEAIKIDITRKKSRLENIESELKKLQARETDLDANLDETAKKMQNMELQLKDIKQAILQKTKEKKDFDSKIDTFKKKNKLEDASQIEEKIVDIDKQTEDIQKDINILREKQHSFIREKDKLEHEINTIDSSISKLKEVESEYREQVQALKDMRESFKKKTNELNNVLDEDSKLAANVSVAREKLKKAVEELAKLEARQITIEESQKADIAVKKVLEQKNKIAGIFGTVAELGKVSSKYSLALEIAAGSKLKSVVVEDDKVAAKAINYLKTNRLGIATFLPLNKIKPRDLNKNIKSLAAKQGSHGTALDLITYDPKFNNVFSYVFENTLVVENIETARKIGIGSIKMVTLDGDIAETSGAMQGGFRKRRSSGIGFKEKELTKDIEEYEASIANYQSTINNYDKQRSENEEIIQKLREEKAELEGEIIKNEKSLHLEHGDFDSSLEKKKLLEEQLNNQEKQVNDAISAISEKNSELARLKIEKQKLRSESLQMRDPKKIAELNTYQEKSQQLKDEIVQLEAEQKNYSSQLSDIFSPEKDKINSILKQLSKEERSFNDESSGLNKDIKELSSTLANKEKEAKQFYTKFKELFGKRGKISEEISKNDLEISKKTDESRQIEIRQNTLSIKNAEVNAVLAGLRQEFSQYEGVELDDSKNEDQLKYQVKKFEDMQSQIGSVNMRALEIYDEVEKEYNGLLEKKSQLETEKQDVVILMEDIESRKKELFMKTFDSVNSNFKRIFSMLSRKGDANLLLEDPEDPLAAGLEIKVRITGNKFLDIRSLSGGEKTMTALSFIFAIQEFDPASFYVLDEVDAALDKHNSEMLAKLIRKYSDKAQYLIISHNDGIISEADNLYGVSMDENGISKVVSLRI